MPYVRVHWADGEIVDLKDLVSYKDFFEAPKENITHAHRLGFKNGDRVICTGITKEWEHDPWKVNLYNPGDIATVGPYGFDVNGGICSGTCGTWELLGDVDVKEVL